MKSQNDSFRKRLFFVITLLIVLNCPNMIKADEKRYNAGNSLSSFLSPAAEDSKTDPQSEEYKTLQKELNRLLEELKELEKDLKNRFQKELLPLLREEIEEIRKKLEEFRKKEKKQKQDDDQKIWT